MKNKLSDDKSEKKGISERVIYRIFEDNNLGNQINAYIILVAVNIIIGLAFEYQNFWKKQDNSIDLESITFFIFYFGIIMCFAKFAERKRSVTWLYPIIAIYLLTFLYLIYDFNALLIEPFNVLQDFFTRKSQALAKVIISPLAAWDLLIGSIVEVFLLFRIFSNINSQK